MRDVQCKRCLEYKGNWCDKKRDDPDPDLVRDCEHYRTRTNADRIRAMTDEVLAALLNTCVCPTKKCPREFEDGCSQDICEACWLDWLKQEAN